MKTVLIISYFHNFKNSIGSRRMRRLSKMLVANGFHVEFLTRTYEYKDCSVQKPYNNAYGPPYKAKVSIFIRVVNKLESLYQRMIEKYSFPSISWVNNILESEKQLYNRVRPSVIICSYPPVESLHLGLELSKLWNVKLIADFRDGFVFNPLENDVLTKCYKYNAYKRIETAIVMSSSAIVAAADSIANYFKSKYKFENSYTVYNGFDTNNLNPYIDYIEPTKTNVVHTGRLSLSNPGICICGFVKSLEMLAKDSDNKDKIIFHFFGNLSDYEIRSFSKFERYGLVKIWGEVDEVLAKRITLAADFLLVIGKNDDPTSISGKLMEYIGSGRPIIGLTGGEAVDIIKTTNIGYCLPPDNARLIYNLFCNLLKESNAISYDPNDSEIFKYSNQFQMNNYLKIVSSVL